MRFQAIKHVPVFFAGIMTLGLALYIFPLIFSLVPFWESQYNLVFFAGIIFLASSVLGALLWSMWPTLGSGFMRRALLLFLPAEILVCFGAIFSSKVHYLLLFPMGVYIVIAFGFWAKHMSQTAFFMETPSFTYSLSTWLRSQGKYALVFVLFTTSLFFSFGLHNLTHFAAVDEPLWTDGRIGKFWKHVSNRNWEKTQVSDKPGITIALAAGPGLWFVTPKEYRGIYPKFTSTDPDRNIEDFYLAFRLPLLIIITLFIPFFYILIERLLGKKTALVAYPLIVLSPILVGISKIINPDSLLWVLAPLSFLAYLVFLERRRFLYLVLAGIFLGLAVLTKYVANILFVFFFALPFIEYLYHQKARLVPFAESLQKSLAALTIVVGTSLATFYLLLPAVWVRQEKLLTSTLYSQAFEKVAPLFLGILLLLSFDTILNRGRGSAWLIQWLSRFERSLAWGMLALFFGSLLFVLLSPQFGMPWFHFEDLLSSPKTVSHATGLIGIFFTNFYPMVFSLPLLTLLGLLVSGVFLLRQDIATSVPARTAFYIVIFILLYYIGATANGVAMITRYQIMLYPLVGLLAALGILWLIDWLSTRVSFIERLRAQEFALPLLVLGILATSLLFTPFPMSYASALLPDQYHTDVKDMGGGSYEAARYLNSLPDAKELLIWTDKSGVCKFFVGQCVDGFNFDLFRAGGLDYIVVSAGRASRTTKMMVNRIYNPAVIRFDTYYQRTDPDFQIFLNGRSSDYVKVFRFLPE